MTEPNTTNPETSGPAHVYALVSAALMFCAYWFFAYWILTHGHPHEDAYILFIYSEHLAAGHGIVYNLGGLHAEGATDFLWMAILAVLTALGINVGIAAGLVNGLGIAVLTYLMIRSLLAGSPKPQAGRIVVGFFFLLLVALSGITAASISGFSAAFYTAVSALLLYLYIKPDIKQLVWVPALSLTLALIRPDGVIIGAGFCALALVRIYSSPYFKTFFIHAACAVIIGLAYFLWRYSYFGNFLPLPLYVKSYGQDLLPGLWTNIAYAKEHALLIILVMAGLLMLPNRKRLALGLLPALALLASLCFAHQSQNIQFRFQAPLTTALFLYLCLIAKHFLDSKPSTKRVVGCSFIILITALSVRSGNGLYRDMMDDDYINYFPYFAREILHSDTTLALTEAGRMAYWTKTQAHDLVGLNNNHIAKNKLSPDYLDATDPDVIFIHTDRSLVSCTERVEWRHKKISANELADAILEQRDWSQVENPVSRAPYVVYDHISRHPQDYDLLLVRYGSRPTHFYAIKKNGAVDYPSFLAALEKSFEATEKKSYLDMIESDQSHSGKL